MKNILVMVASRERNLIKRDRRIPDELRKASAPERLLRTINMLYNTCDYRGNFDVQVIIDDDQIEIFAPVKEKYPDLIWTYVKHIDKNWYPIFEAHHNLFRQNKWYFTMWVADDMYNLSKHWDTAIIEKKGYFSDDLFVLYTDSRYANRTPALHINCYTGRRCLNKFTPEGSKDSKHVFSSTVNQCEHTPIWTYKFGEFLYPLFDKLKLPFWREIIICEIIKLLYMRGNNRYVFCQIDYMLVDDNTTDRLPAKIEWYEDLFNCVTNIERGVFNINCG